MLGSSSVMSPTFSARPVAGASGGDGHREDEDQCGCSGPPVHFELVTVDAGGLAT
jgi:hypothetical protein